MNKHLRIEGCTELTHNDKELFDILKQNKERYYVVIDNDIIWVVDRELMDKGLDDVIVGDFDSYGQEHIMSMFEYMNITAEYC